MGLNRNTANRYFPFFRSLVISQALKEHHEEKIANGVEVDEVILVPKDKRAKEDEAQEKRL